MYLKFKHLIFLQILCKFNAYCLDYQPKQLKNLTGIKT
ncbi:hypothetical protein D029_4709 [Vibrio parahaemolyticus 970107]|nr:hypothetical protein D029_4709 [Vibrio parahaemolyticus 970107]